MRNWELCLRRITNGVRAAILPWASSVGGSVAVLATPRKVLSMDLVKIQRYDGSFPLGILHFRETVCSAGDGTGACLIVGPLGVTRVNIGDTVIRLASGALQAFPR